MRGVLEWWGRRCSQSTWVWSIATTPFATLFICFVFFGVTTDAIAESGAEQRASRALTVFAAEICYERFISAPSAREALASFMDVSPYVRDEVLAQAGWVTFGSREFPLSRAADLCALRLANTDIAAGAVGYGKHKQ